MGERPWSIAYVMQFRLLRTGCSLQRPYALGFLPPMALAMSEPAPLATTPPMADFMAISAIFVPILPSNVAAIHHQLVANLGHAACQAAATYSTLVAGADLVVIELVLLAHVHG